MKTTFKTIALICMLFVGTMISVVGCSSSKKASSGTSTSTTTTTSTDTTGTKTNPH